MALIMLCGLPSSGKTHRAQQLAADFQARIAAQDDAATARRMLTLHVISDHGAQIPRSAYAAAASEKTARATLYSAVKRALGRDAIVLLDAPNYIKGWRYQLHCEAKAAGVRSSVLQVGVGPAAARAYNEARAAGANVDGAAPQSRYSDTLWDEVSMRFEEPNGNARWDSPLYVVAGEDAAPPAARMWREVVLGVAADGARMPAVRPNQATVTAAPAAGSHLQELERATQAVVACVVAAQSRRVEAGEDPGGATGVEGEGLAYAGELVLPVGRRLTQPHLQRLRRQFVAMHRQQMGGLGMGAIGKGDGKGGLTRERVAALYVDWLNDAFTKE